MNRRNFLKNLGIVGLLSVASVFPKEGAVQETQTEPFDAVRYIVFPKQTTYQVYYRPIK